MKGSIENRVRWLQGIKEKVGGRGKQRRAYVDEWGEWRVLVGGMEMLMGMRMKNNERKRNLNDRKMYKNMESCVHTIKPCREMESVVYY